MKTNKKKYINIVNRFLKYLFFIITLIAIGLLYPDRAYFKYEYNKGDTWQYETVKAPFSFPILRTQKELEEERNKIIENFIPHYKLDSSVLRAVLAYVDNLPVDTSGNTGTPAKLKSFLKKELTNIYLNGVLPDDEYQNLKGKGLIVDTGGKTEKHDYEHLFSVSKAKKYLEKKLSLFFPGYKNLAGEIPVLPNLHNNTNINKKLLEEELKKIPPSAGIIAKGETVIAKNDIITSEKYKILNSYKEAYIKQVGKTSSFYYLYAGYLLLSLLILGMLYFYIKKTEPAIFESPRKILFLLIWIMLFAYLVFIADQQNPLYVYAIPFVLVPVVVMNFFKKQLALYLHIIIILIASLITRLGYEFTVLQLIAGMMSTMIFDDLRFWNKFFKGIFIILLSYIVGYISLSLINNGSFNEIEWRAIVAFVINALLLLLAYPLIPLIEKPFGFVSNITISELGDMNKPLLKELSLKAPGTLQHSLQVANLCEAAAEKIGANSLLIKVGALYHDIGKTYAPEYFIENQKQNQNPYENLDNFESAKRIINHVIEGKKMAAKAGLPKVLQRFITTHHGTTRVEYFYRKQLNEHPEKEFDESLFRYPGPKPATKEETIMMLADSIEAASKSLDNPTAAGIDKLVEDIVKYKIDDGQLEESELTFKELEEVKSVFKDILKNIYHIRIKYPELKNKK